jgi:hypothetical protein
VRLRLEFLRVRGDVRSGQARRRRAWTHLKVLGHVQKRRVRHHDRFCNVFEREVDGVAAAEAVARCAERGRALSLERLDDGIEERARALRPVVVPEPLADVEVLLDVWARGTGEKGEGRTPASIASTGIGSPCR